MPCSAASQPSALLQTTIPIGQLQTWMAGCECQAGSCDLRGGEQPAQAELPSGCYALHAAKGTSQAHLRTSDLVASYATSMWCLPHAYQR